MPSSSALVATTARISPSRSLRSISRRSLGKIAAAVAAHHADGKRAAVAGIAQIGHQDFRGQAVVGEDQRLLAALDELSAMRRRLVQIAAADAELAVHHRRIVEDEILLAAWARRCDPPVRKARR